MTSDSLTSKVSLTGLLAVSISVDVPSGVTSSSFSHRGGGVQPPVAISDAGLANCGGVGVSVAVGIGVAAGVFVANPVGVTVPVGPGPATPGTWGSKAATTPTASTAGIATRSASANGQPCVGCRRGDVDSECRRPSPGSELIACLLPAAATA